MVPPIYMLSSQIRFLPRKKHALLMTGFSLFWEISAHDELWEADTLLR